MALHRKFPLKSVVLALATCFATSAQANPTGASIAAGQATIQQNGSTLTITNTPGTIINWQSFNINRGELTRFVQQNAQSQVLNRVTGVNPSQILGQLQSNGRVLLINPNGVLFGKGAQVDVAGLIVSTLQLKDADFLAGKLKFNDTPGAGKIENQGEIKTASGGHVILIAPKIENSGIIQSPEGHILLAAGKSVTLSDPDKPAIQVEVTNSENTAVNLGSLIAKNISIYGGIIKNSGLIQATTAVVGENGKIRLQAKIDVENTGTLQANGAQGGDILIQAQTGNANIQGVVEAKGVNATVDMPNSAKTETSPLTGGRIEILAPFINLDATVDASGINGGGVILIGGEYQGGNNPIPTDWNQNKALQRASLSLSDLYATSPSLTETNLTNTSDPSQQTGSTSQGNPFLPKRSLPTARTVTIGANARIRSDATDKGDGGVIVVWSDGTTTAQGSFSARGGINGGNGGLIETSGHIVLLGGISVTTLAYKGLAGTWLLDPDDVEINGVLSVAGATLVTPATIEVALAGGNFIIQTNVAGSSGNGDIIVNDSVSWSNDNALTLSAQRHINVNAIIENTGSGVVNLRADNQGLCVAGASDCGTINFAAGSITLNGGTANLYYNPVGSNTIADLANGLWPSYTPTDFSLNVTGGTMNAWMLVNDVNQLQAIGYSGNYALGRNVDAAVTSTWDSGYGFAPIDFVGRFNGLGHTIDSLMIYRRSEDNIGLFSANSLGSQITNVGLTNANVTGRFSVGGLVGVNAGIINNSYVTGNVTGVENVGGLVGKNITAGTISNSHVTGNVYANSDGYASAGGLVGENAGTISNSHVTGSITSLGHDSGNPAGAGGLVSDNSGTINNSYVIAANVTSNGYAGLLVGSNEGTISNSYATGSVTGQDYVGGLVGYKGGTINNSFYDIDNVLINSGHHVTLGGLYNAQYQDWNTHNLTLDIANYSSTLPLVNGYYQVSSVDGLKNLLGFAGESGYKFRLTADLNLAGATGFFIPYFSASEFDGASHTLSNLTVSQPFNDRIGMFGQLASGGTIKNLGVLNANVTGSYAVGGLVGSNLGSISNSYATGSVTGDGAIGGLVGSSNGVISNSYATVSVTGIEYVGGLVGSNEGTVNNSYWDIETSGQMSSAGGTGRTSAQMKQQGSFIGWDFDGTWQINEGVSPPTLGASVFNDWTGLADNRYWTTAGNWSLGHAPTSSEKVRIYDVAGTNFIDYTGSYSIKSIVSDELFSFTVAGSHLSLNGNGTFNAGLNLVAGSTLTANGSLSLNNGLSIAIGAKVDLGATDSLAIDGNAYILIRDVNQLQAINANLTARYALAGNIDAAVSSGWSGGQGFVPVASSGSFTGVFNGLGHSIDNLTINRPSQYNVGLFGYVGAGGQITNAGLNNANVTGNGYVGGLVGYNEGTISNSYTTGSVAGNSYVGGLVGHNNSGTIINSYMAGSVTGSDQVGGLVGFNRYGTISDSYATGGVTGTTHVGGLVGINYGEISNSYATGNVGGDYYVGGLVGWNTNAMISNSYAAGSVNGISEVGGLVGENDLSPIINSYATGSVTGDTNVGGLVGYNDGVINNSYATGSVTGVTNVGGLVGVSYDTISNSYWNVDTTGQTLSAGGTGLTSAQMKQQASFIGFDFGGTWQVNEGISYPTLIVSVFNDWTGLADNRYWATAGNWSLGHAPTSSEKVRIYDVAGTSLIDYTGSYSIKSIISDELFTFTVAGSHLTLNGSGAFNAGLNLVAGSTLTANGALSLNNGLSIAIGAKVDLGATASLNIDGNAYTLIRDVNQLQAMNADWYGRYALAANIDAAVTSGWNSGAGFAPINNFMGMFNGLGHSIDNLTINLPAYSAVGLFSVTDPGVQIANVGLNNTNVTGGSVVGSLVGQNAGTISNSYVTGSVTGNSYVGGLVGLNYYGTISNSYATGSVTGGSNVGGLVGQNDYGTISNSFYDIDNLLVNGSHNVTLNGLYNTQFQDWMSNNQILPGIAYYFTQDAGGYWQISNVQGLKNLLPYAGDTGNKYRLTTNIDLSSAPDYYLPEFHGKELDGANFTISNASAVYLGRDNVGFIGLLGDGSAVRNLKLANVNIQGNSYVGGLVGYTDFGIVENSHVLSGSVTGANYATGGLVGFSNGLVLSSSSAATVTGVDGVGGLVGENDGIIAKSHSSGLVIGTGYYTGGLVGELYGVVADSYSTATVSGADETGGLVGENWGGSIFSSYSTGAVNGGQWTGGLVGWNLGSVGDSYSLSPVTGTDQVGGLAGSNEGAIRNSFSAGIVTASGSSKGGLVGENTGTVTGSFWDKDISGLATSAGGVGLTTAQTLLQGSYTSWDFSGTWNSPTGAAPSLRPLTLSVWSGAAADQNFNNTANWLLGHVPQAGETALIYGYHGDVVNITANVSTERIASNQQLHLANDVQVTASNHLTVSVWTSGSLTLGDRAALTTASLNASLPSFGDKAHIDLPEGSNASVSLEGYGYTVISDVAQLQSMNSMPGGRFVLAKDIDASATATWNSDGSGGYYGFAPVKTFGGSLDGFGHVITDLYINRPVETEVGLIGWLSNNGRVSNLGLYGGAVTGGEFNVGGVVGYLESGTVNNVFSTLSVSGLSDVGGLVGFVDSGSAVSKSYSSGNVSGQAGVGGLVGGNRGDIQSSFASGNVTDTCPISSGCSDFGGLVGGNFGNITKSFATGDVTVFGNHGNVGGLVGDHAVGLVSDSYATGAVTGGGGGNFGGLIGLVRSGGGVNNVFSLGSVSSSGGSEIGALIGTSTTLYGGGAIGLTNAYWNADVTGALPGVGYNNGATLTNVTGKSTAQLQQAASFAGWNSSDTWAISNGTTPTLLNMPSVYVPLSSTNVWTGGVNQLWSNAGNWSLGHVPTAAEQVRIYDVAGTSFIDYTGAYSVKSIVSDELFSLTAGSSYLTLQESSAFNAGLNLGAGSTLSLNSGVLTVAIPSSGITLNGTISAPSVKLNGVGMTGDVSQSVAGVITATDLHITEAGLVSLAGSNNVQNLAATAASLSYNGIGDLALVSHPTTVGAAIVVNGDALVRTTGNLTLSDSLQSTLGDITLAAGGNFIRSNGSLSATNGRWLVYSTSPLTDTLNGLTSDFVHYGQTYTGGAAYAGPGIGNGFMYSVAPTLTLSLGPVSRGYDGTQDAALNASNFSVTGQINGDLVVVDNVLGSFDSANAGTRTLTAGGLTLAANNGATAVYGYNFNTTASNTASTISKANLTVSANAASKTYDGLAYTGGNGVAYSGFVNGETASVLGGSLSYGGTAQNAINAGSYTLAASGQTSGNYNLNYVDSGLTISKALLTVSADNQSRSYGASNPTLTTTVSGFVNGESVAAALGYSGTGTATTTATGTTNVGSAVITAGSGTLAASNYDFTNLSNGILTISKADLTVTANAASKTYDGLAYTGGNGVAYSGFVNGESASVLGGSLSYGGTAQNAINAGSYTLAASGQTSGNYNINYVDSGLTVSKALLTVTADNQSRIYGASNPTLTTTVSGFVNGESAATALGYSGTGTATTTATNTTNAGTAVITAGSGTLAASNYDFTNLSNGILTISKADLTVTANAASKTYDGLAYTGGNGVAYSGFVNGESASVLGGSLSYGGTAQNAINAGSYILAASGQTSGNYNINYVDSGLTVAQRALIVTADGQSKVYGLADPTLSYVVGGAGLVGGESFSGALSRAAGQNVGSYAISQNSLSAGGNYAISYVDANLTVTPAMLGVTANTQGKVYGQTDPSLTYGVSGLQYSDTAGSVLTGNLARSAGETVTGGPYAINQGALVANGNYTIAYTGSNLTINPASLSVSANAQTKVYGDADPALTYSVTGLKFSDTAGAVLSGGLSRAAGETVAGGPYAISQSNLAANSNYNIAYTGNNLTISQRPVDAVVTGSVSKEYDATTVASLGSNYSLSNVLAGDLASLGVSAASGNYADKNAGSGKTVTFSGLSLSGTAAGNYQLTPTVLTSNSAVIDPKALAVWTGTAGDGSWKNAANWQGGVAPEAANVLNASFPVGNGAVVFDMTVPTTLHSIDTFRNLTLTNSSTLTLGTLLTDVSYVRPDATLTLQSGNHILNGTLNAAGFELSGGQLAGNGVLNLSANSTLAGGALAVATTNNLAGAQINVTGSTVLAGILNNFGVFNTTATGSLAVQAGAVLNAMAGSTWANAGTVNIQGTANAEAGASFDFAGGVWNFAEGSAFSGAGSFTRTGATLNLTGAGAGTTVAAETSLDLNALAFGGNGNLNNFGLLSANNLTLGGSLANNGIFNVLGTVTVGGLYTDQVAGAMIIPAGSIFRMNNASGLFRWSGGVLGNPNGAAGTLGFANGASFQFAGNGDRVIDGMNFNFTDLTLPNGSVTVRSGHLTLDGTSTIPTGVGLNVDGGTLTNNGQLNIAGSFALDSGAFDGTGGIDMQGGVMSKPASSSIAWTNTGNLNNTGTLDFGGGTITNAITNAGTINVGSGVVFQQLFTNNGGTLVVQPGTTTFSGGYSQSGGQTQLQGGSIVGDFNLSGGVLKGSGTINGNMTISGGTLAVGYSPGSLNVTGNLNLNSSSILNIELGGTTPGSGYDVINVSGIANLAGTLNVLGWGGYAPAPGAAFNFLNFSGQTGGFSTVNLPAGWNVSLNSGSGYLQLRMADLTNSSVVSGLQGLSASAGQISPYQALLNSLMQTGASNIDLSALTINDTTIGFNRITPNDYSSSLVQLLDDLTQVAPVTEFDDEKVCR